MFKKKSGLQEAKPLGTGKKRRRKKIVIIGAGALILLVAVVIFARGFGGSNLPIVEAEPVKRGDLVSVINTNGTVLSLNEKTYFSPVNAKIASQDLMVGQVVKRGDQLVSFATDALERDNQKTALTTSSTINTNRDTLKKSNKTLAEASDASRRVNALQTDVDRYKSYITNLNNSIIDRTKELARQAMSDAADFAGTQQSELAALNRILPSAMEKETLTAMNNELQTEVESLSIDQSKAEFDEDSSTAELLREQIADKQEKIEKNQEKIDSLTKEMGSYREMSAEEIRSQITELSMGESTGGLTDASSDPVILDLQNELRSAESTLTELQSDLAEEKAKVSAGENAEITNEGRTALENQNNLAELESATAEELLRLGKKGIHAEFSGIVTKADATQGAEATQGMELVTVASNRDVAVEATVSKYDFSRLREGQKAKIVIGDNTYQGHVSVISKVAQLNDKNTPVITCRITIDDPDDNVFLGVEAKVTITTATADDVLNVPLEAVNVTADGSFCDILENGIVTRREISTGISSDTHIEVTNGLSENDQIITKLPIDVKEGTEAQIGDIEESPDSDAE